MFGKEFQKSSELIAKISALHIREETMNTSGVPSTVTLPANVDQALGLVGKGIIELMLLSDLKIEVDRSHMMDPSKVSGGKYLQTLDVDDFPREGGVDAINSVRELTAFFGFLCNQGPHYQGQPLGRSYALFLYSWAYNERVSPGSFEKNKLALIEPNSKDRFERLMAALYPSAPVIKLLIRGFEALIQKTVELAIEKGNFRGIEVLVKSTMTSANTCMEKLYPRTQARRTTEAFRRRKQKNPSLQPKENDFETYTAVCKAMIDPAAGVYLGPEKREISRLNERLQKVAAGVQVPHPYTLTEWVNKTRTAISKLQERVKLLKDVGLVRKRAVHAWMTTHQKELPSFKDKDEKSPSPNAPRQPFTAADWEHAIGRSVTPDAFKQAKVAAFGCSDVNEIDWESLVFQLYGLQEENPPDGQVADSEE